MEKQGKVWEASREAGAKFGKNDIYNHWERADQNDIALNKVPSKDIYYSYKSPNKRWDTRWCNQCFQKFKSKQTHTYMHIYVIP